MATREEVALRRHKEVTEAAAAKKKEQASHREVVKSTQEALVGQLADLVTELEAAGVDPIKLDSVRSAFKDAQAQLRLVVAEENARANAPSTSRNKENYAESGHKPSDQAGMNNRRLPGTNAPEVLAERALAGDPVAAETQVGIAALSGGDVPTSSDPQILAEGVINEPDLPEFVKPREGQGVAEREKIDAEKADAAEDHHKDTKKATAKTTTTKKTSVFGE